MRWIKVETHLPNKSEVVRIAQQLNISPHEAAGRCLTFWSWADSETADGQLPGCSHQVIDYTVGVPGFAGALVTVGWLIDTEYGMRIPRFERHNGQSAKKRVAAAERQFRRRVQQEAY